MGEAESGAVDGALDGSALSDYLTPPELAETRVKEGIYAAIARMRMEWSDHEWRH